MRPWKRHDLTAGKILFMAANFATNRRQASSSKFDLFNFEGGRSYSLPAPIDGERHVTVLVRSQLWQTREKCLDLSPVFVFLGFDMVLFVPDPPVTRSREESPEECRKSESDHVYKFWDYIHSGSIVQPNGYSCNVRARFLASLKNDDSKLVSLLGDTKAALVEKIKANFIPMENVEATYRSRFPKRADEIIAKINAGI